MSWTGSVRIMNESGRAMTATAAASRDRTCATLSGCTNNARVPGTSSMREFTVLHSIPVGGEPRRVSAVPRGHRVDVHQGPAGTAADRAVLAEDVVPQHEIPPGGGDADLVSVPEPWPGQSGAGEHATTVDAADLANAAAAGATRAKRVEFRDSAD